MAAEPATREQVPSRPTVVGAPGARERLVFATATGVIVLHILVASFLAIEPGAARADHVLAAAVPTALAVVTVAFYTRLRAGFRAVLALLFGLLAIVAASVAVAETAAVGPQGEDWTGFLLIPTGIVLCGLGAWLLWQSRRHDRRRYLRRLLLTLAAAVLAYWIVAPICFAIVVTHKPRASVQPADLGRPYRDVTIRTSDGLDLAGWYVPSRNGAAVIVFPGRTGAVPQARMLARHGYGVLLLDMRGQGESEGDPNGLGWGSSKDLDAAVAFLDAQPDVRDQRIGGLGLSVGGEQLLETAAKNNGLKAVVSEGAGLRSVRESLARKDVPRIQVWLQYPFDAVLTGATIVLGGHLPPPSLERLVQEIAPRPAYFIYGGRGQAAEKALTPAYYHAAAPPKTLWEIPEAEHTGGFEARPREYEQRIVDFFDQSAPGRAMNQLRPAVGRPETWLVAAGQDRVRYWGKQ
jgi:uncharacterized protein